MPTLTAFRMGSLNAAEYFRLYDRGAIAPGRDATLVLATGDVLDARTQVTGVWIDGAAQPLETKHTRLYERYKDRP